MRTLIVAIALVVGSVPAMAQSAPPAGVRSCSGCHAPQKLGTPVPALVGHSSGEIASAMQDFRSGKRSSTVMGRIAKGFSDDEIKALSDWIAAHPEKAQ